MENISEENYYKLRNESIRATSDMNIIDLGSENLDKSTQERKYYNIFYITKSVVVLAKDYSYDNKIKCLEKIYTKKEILNNYELDKLDYIYKFMKIKTDLS